MNDALALLLLRQTVLLTAAITLTGFGLSVLKIRSARWHQLAWTSALFMGWVHATLTVELPTPRLEQMTNLNFAWLQPSVDNHEIVKSIPAEHFESSIEPPSEVILVSQKGSSDGMLVNILLTVWCGGMFVCVLMPCWRYLQLLRLLKHRIPACGEWQEECRSACRVAGIRKQVTLAVIAEFGPAICRRPGGYTIIVPAKKWGLLSAMQRDAILKHELAHLRYGDVWTSLLTYAAAIPHWLNPLAWYAFRRCEESKEWACDEKIGTQTPAEIAEYARALLQLGTQTKPVPSVASASAGHGLVRRVRRMFSETVTKDRAMKKLSLVTLLLVIAGAGSVRLRADADEAASVTAPTPVIGSANLTASEQPAAAASATGGELTLEPLLTQFQVESISGDDPHDSVPVRPVELNEITRTEENAISQSAEEPSLKEHRREATLDVSRLFRQLPQFEQGRRRMQSEVQRLSKQLEDQKSNPNRQNSDAAQETKSAQDLLRQMEADLYWEIYSLVRDETAAYAKEHHFQVVRRAQDSPLAQRPADPRDVMKALNSDVLYSESQIPDITDDILIRLKKKHEVTQEPA